MIDGSVALSPRRRPRRPVAMLAAVTAVGLTACGGEGPTRSVTPSSATASSSSASATNTAGTSAGASAPSAPPSDPGSSAKSPPTSPSSSGTASGTGSSALAACASLDVAVTRVPGAAGVTYAVVTVTNRGTTTCGLPGVPAIRLLAADRTAVTASATADGGGDGPDLAPGAVASTLLADTTSTCQADSRSSFAEVTATPAAPPVVTELALPPCSLSVRPFVSGTSPQP